MSDIKPKLILRPGLNLSDKSPSPSTKLMLNHGKPNFTINRSKSRVESLTPPTPVTPEASQMILKSTTLNGYVKPANLNISNQNEAHQVVLRKTKLPEANDKSGEDEEVKRVVLRRIKLPEVNDKAVQGDEPEFIKAQRKIAERLAKENNLDFENRKSGYFTHVMMSPTSTKTFELPVTQTGKIQQATLLEVVEVPAKPKETVFENNSNTEVAAEPFQNGDIIECNGTGEKDTDIVQAAKALVEEVVQSVPEDIPVAPVAAEEPVQNGVHLTENDEQNAIKNGNQSAITNGIQNGDSHKDESDINSTTSAPVDVNFEPKTVTSVAKELSNEPNNYPDTVVVTKQVEPADKDHQFIEDMAKLKFDITKENLEVTPTLRLDSEKNVA